MPRAQGRARAAIVKLVALMLKSRVNLTSYHGVFAPNSRHCVLVMPAKQEKAEGPLWVASSYTYLREWNSCSYIKSGYTIDVIFNNAYSSKRPKAAILIGRYLIVGTVFGVDVVIEFLHDLWEWLAAT